MKGLLVLTLCSLLILQLTDSALLRKSDASDFLAMVRKKHEDNEPCDDGKCDLNDSSDAFDDRNIRMRSDKRMDSSSSDSAMMPQEILLPPTPPEGTTK